VVSHLTRWIVPVAAAASILTAVLTFPELRRQSGPPAQSPTIAEILGVPSAVIRLSRSREVPDVAALASALNTEPIHER
jgi:hypothetical protein